MNTDRPSEKAVLTLAALLTTGAVATIYMVFDFVTTVAGC